MLQQYFVGTFNVNDLTKPHSSQLKVCSSCVEVAGWGVTSCIRISSPHWGQGADVAVRGGGEVIGNSIGAPSEQELQASNHFHAYQCAGF